MFDCHVYIYISDIMATNLQEPFSIQSCRIEIVVFLLKFPRCLFLMSLFVNE